MTQDCEITWIEEDGEHRVVYTAASLSLLQDAKAIIEQHTRELAIGQVEGRALVRILDRILAGTPRKKKHFLNGQLNDLPDSPRNVPAVEEIRVEPELGEDGEVRKYILASEERYKNGQRQDESPCEPGFRQQLFNVDPYDFSEKANAKRKAGRVIAGAHYSQGQKIRDISADEIKEYNDQADKNDKDKNEIQRNPVKGFKLST